MSQHPSPNGQQDRIIGGLSLLRSHARLILAVILFSTVVNGLMLTAPLFAMQVYDRVLSSRSEPTLTALFILVAFLFVAMAVLDAVRGQIMARIGTRLQQSLDPLVFTTKRQAGDDHNTSATAQDVDTVHHFIASPAFFALIDLPWTPIFLIGIFLFHPWLGTLAIAGGGILFLLAWANHLMTAPLSRNVLDAARTADRMRQQYRCDITTADALGMRHTLSERWRTHRERLSQTALTATDRSHIFGSANRVFRQFLQSAMLALGAWLVLRHEVTAGVMITSSVLMGRALAPLEGLIGHWPFIQSVAVSWRRLTHSLQHAPHPHVTHHPPPTASLRIRPLTAPFLPKRAPHPVQFNLDPGQCLGVIGPTGSGKTTLALSLTGQFTSLNQQVMLGGVPIEQYGDGLALHVGYLPQRVRLFDGSIAENIARMRIAPDCFAVQTAAKQVGIHDQILSLPQGYDTWIDGDAPHRPCGLVQQIGLARAFYGSPPLIVLDAPHNNLDGIGIRGLHTAIATAKAAGRSVVITAPHPTATDACDLILMLDQGQQHAFGPKDLILPHLARDPVHTAATVLYNRRSEASG